MQNCANCAPSNAKWYVEIVYGRDVHGFPETTETDYAHAYMCDAHKVTPAKLLPENDPLWERSARWKVLESNTVDLAKRRGLSLPAIG